jgi:hypothetical protein
VSKCVTCGKDHEELAAAGVNPRHPFNDGSLPSSATFGVKGPDGRRIGPSGGKEPQPEVQVVDWPFDPVLRQALITKGVLTVEDLREAEQTILAVTAQFGGRIDDKPNGPVAPGTQLT